MLALLTSKPILIGLHLGSAILGIDAMLWLLGEYAAKAQQLSRKVWAAGLAIVGFLASWVIGGYYYVVYYGTQVKPVIKAGSVPWAHAVAMEAKEHIFLLLPPLTITMLLLVLAEYPNLRRPMMWLAGTIAFLGLSIGLMGYIISAAARWAI